MTNLRSECIRFGEAVIADVIVSEVVFPLFVNHEVEKELKLTRLILIPYNLPLRGARAPISH